MITPPQAAPSLSASPGSQADVDPGSLVMTKRLIWLYFWLLILEGALRKWVVPGLSNPLLLVRDPVVVAIYIGALMARVFPWNGWVATILVFSGVSTLVSEIAGSGNLMVTLYGFRTSFLHLPLIFVIPAVFNRQDLNSFKKWYLLSTIPMALLVLLQFRAGPESWLNVGAGGAVGSQMESAFGRIRPPGTFSFTAMIVYYITGAAAFALDSLITGNKENKKLVLASLFSLVVMIALSGSRTAVGSIVLNLAAVAFTCLRIPRFFGGGIKLVFVAGILCIGLSMAGDIKAGLMVHAERVESGGGLKEGILDRTLGGFIAPFQGISDLPFFGMGLGMGTNGASNFLYGQSGFSLGEDDWERTLKEMGPVLGLLFIGLRVALVGLMFKRSLRALAHDAPLALLFFSSALPQVLNGQMGVPGLLGFTVFSGGLCLAAARVAEEPEAGAAPVSQAAEPAAKPLVRGRSAYAEQLHGTDQNSHTRRYGP